MFIWVMTMKLVTKNNPYKRWQMQSINQTFMLKEEI